MILRMAKQSKKSRGPKVPNRHAHARTSFLYQAAMYFTNLSDQNDAPKDLPDPSEITTHSVNSDQEGSLSKLHHNALPAYFTSQLRSVSLKSQAKLSKSIKRSICKRCNVLLIPNNTSVARIENKSAEEKKPWADALLVTCLGCSMQKRFPIVSKLDWIGNKINDLDARDTRAGTAKIEGSR
jgi:ribonuclease P protein subunit RPR2